MKSIILNLLIKKYLKGIINVILSDMLSYDMLCYVRFSYVMCIC